MYFAGEYRKQVILEHVNSEGKVSISDLVKKLKISKETIRRYLSELESENKLRRIYGGAVRLSYGEEEISFDDKILINQLEKEKIAKTAADMINDNDVIIIDDGTTTIRIIKYIRKNHIKIITNSFPVANEVMNCINNNVFAGELIFIGGKVNLKNSRTGGTISERIAGYMQFNKAFLSCDGLSLKDGATCFNLEKTFLSQKYFDLGEEIILLVDGSKINKTAHHKIEDLEKLNFIICDKEMPSEWATIKKKMNWIIAKNT